MAIPPYYAMPPFRKDPSIHQRAHLLFESRWRREAVARDARASRATGFRWETHIDIYGGTTVPRDLYQLGRSRSISPAALDALLDYQHQKPWLYQEELARYLAEEWDTYVHQSTISRALGKANVSRKKGQRIGPQSEELRVAWQAFASQVEAEQLVFIDETLFKLQTMWRSMAYAPIGDPARYHGDMRRGDMYSVLPAYTTDGYLPYTGIKKGYYSKDDIIDWSTNHLLPLCNEYPRERSIIVLDSVSVHIDPRVILKAFCGMPSSIVAAIDMRRSTLNTVTLAIYSMVRSKHLNGIWHSNIRMLYCIYYI